MLFHRSSLCGGFYGGRLFSSMSRRDFFLVMLVVVAWGLHAPVMKMGVELVPAVSLNVARFLGTGLLFLPFARLPRGKEWGNLFKIAILFNCGNLILSYIALDYISSNSFIILIMVAVPISILLDRVLKGRTFGGHTALGIFICFAGLFIAFGAPDLLQSPLGAFYAVVAAFFWSLGSFYMKETEHINLPTFLSATYLMAVPVAVFVSYFREEGQLTAFLEADRVDLIGVLIYQVGLMSVMMFVWKGLMSRNPAQYVTPFLMIQPIFGVLGAYALLGEALSIEIAVGGGVILAGLSIINIRKLLKYRRRKNV